MKRSRSRLSFGGRSLPPLPSRKPQRQLKQSHDGLWAPLQMTHAGNNEVTKLTLFRNSNHDEFSSELFPSFVAGEG